MLSVPDLKICNNLYDKSTAQHTTPNAILLTNSQIYCELIDKSQNTYIFMDLLWAPNDIHFL